MNREKLLYTLAAAAYTKEAGVWDYAAPVMGGIAGGGLGLLAGGIPGGMAGAGLGIAAGKKWNDSRAPAPSVAPPEAHANRPPVSALAGSPGSAKAPSAPGAATGGGSAL